MKTLITAAIAASALASAVPAMAQAYVNDHGATVERRIDYGLRSGSLSYGEASMLRARLRQIQRMQDRYEYGGLSGRAAHDLDVQYDRLSDQVHRMNQQTQYRYDRRNDLW